MSSEHDGTIAVREGEGVDRARIGRFLREQVPDLPEGEVEMRQFPAGASNLTYLLRVAGWEAVLRRPPLGPVAPRAPLSAQGTIRAAIADFG